MSFTIAADGLSAAVTNIQIISQKIGMNALQIVYLCDF